MAKSACFYLRPFFSTPVEMRDKVGPNASHLAAACERAKTVIVEVNQNMPYCLGGFENCIHINQVDMI